MCHASARFYYFLGSDVWAWPRRECNFWLCGLDWLPERNVAGLNTRDPQLNITVSLGEVVRLPCMSCLSSFLSLLCLLWATYLKFYWNWTVGPGIIVLRAMLIHTYIEHKHN